MRKIEPAPSRIILPARLWHLPGYLPEVSWKQANRLPGWMSDDQFARIIDWERRRWSLQQYNHQLTVGLHKLSWHVDRLMTQVKPAVVMTTNKIDHGCELFYEAAKYYGSTYRFVERSPLDSIIVEPRGMFAESDVFQQFDPEASIANDMLVRAGEAEIDKIRLNVEGFRQQAPLGLEEWRRLLAVSGPLILMPMDNVLWTGLAQEDHPQAQLDYPPDLRDTDSLIRMVAAEADRFGGTVCIKLHPAEREPLLRKTAPLPSNMIVVRDGLNDLLGQCDAVVTLLSKVAFPALALGIPTAVLKTNTAAAATDEHVFSTSRSLRAAVASLCQDATLRPGHRNAPKKRLAAFLGWAAKRFYIGLQQPIHFGERNVVTLAEEIVDSASEKALVPSNLGARRWKIV